MEPHAAAPHFAVFHGAIGGNGLAQGGLGAHLDDGVQERVYGARSTGYGVDCARDSLR